MKYKLSSIHFITAFLFSFCFCFYGKAGLTGTKYYETHSDRSDFPLNFGPPDSSRTWKYTNASPAYTSAGNSASVSPELTNLVDQLTHPDLPFYFSGYVDVYFLKNLNNPQNGSNTGISGAARAFDQKEDQFQLGMAQTKFGWNKKKVDATIDLTFGPNADLGNYGNKTGPLGQAIGTSALCIKQAFITYKLNQRNNFTIGQFGTHIGYEVIESYINYNYSLSNLFNNGPFYHQGLKFTHNFGTKTTFMAGIVNNWDNLYDNNSFKTAISQITFSPKKTLFFSLNYIGGNEETITDSLQNTQYHSKSTTRSFKQLLDFVANIQISDKLYFGINAAFGALQQKQNKDLNTKALKTWGGAAVYMSCSFTPKIGMGLRGEIFDNSDGVQYIGKTDVQSYTATFNIKLDQDLFFKPECRFDLYKKNNTGKSLADEQFMDASGTHSKNSQMTIGAAVIYRF
jgi:hypothetical protein